MVQEGQEGGEGQAPQRCCFSRLTPLSLHPEAWRLQAPQLTCRAKSHEEFSEIERYLTKQSCQAQHECSLLLLRHWQVLSVNTAQEP